MEDFINVISNFFINLIKDIGNTFYGFSDLGNMNLYEAGNTFIKAFGYIFIFFMAYRVVYTIIGAVTTRKFAPAKNQHKYAILIAARNEEQVIGNLLDSIKKQDYPEELITTFVVADNCTDKTAEIARANGAVCYERFNDENKTKGFALQFLLERIEEDYKRDSFEGYFLFDADNLLKRDFVSRMNDSFDAGEKIVCSYRNTKNFDDNWISASYAIHWLRSIRLNHRPRAFFKLATNIQGTGFLFASEIVKDGWSYTSLTEDRALTADAVAQGYHISYNNDAEFYDEQPVSLKIALRQRIRWAKGHILAFAESGWKLFKNMFTAKKFSNRFMSFDMFIHITPLSLFTLAADIILGILYTYVFINKGFTACLFTILGWRISKIAGSFAAGLVEATYVFISEHKRIKKIKWYKKIWYSIMWPTFDLIGKWSMYIALFKKVSWKPIPHESKINIEDTERHIAGEKKVK